MAVIGISEAVVNAIRLLCYLALDAIRRQWFWRQSLMKRDMAGSLGLSIYFARIERRLSLFVVLET